MRKHPRLLLWFIILITALTVFINVPPFTLNLPHLGFSLPGQRNTTTKFTFPGFSMGWLTKNPQTQGPLTFHKGLDLQGGTSITLRADMSHVPSDQRQAALEGAQTVIERRVNLYGVSEPVIQTITANNDYRLVVELPGVNDAQARQLVGTTAQLSFWEFATASAQVIPNAPIIAYGKLVKQTNLTGKDLKSATVVFDPNTSNPQVQLTFTEDGAKKFADITTRNVGKPLMIVLDGLVIEGPTVNQAIIGGNAVISGKFTTDQAKQLSIELQAGVLPIPLSMLATQTVGATLGQDALVKSIFAGLLGFVIVVIFMVILYGRLGLIASAALFLYTLLVLTLFKLIPVTLTLAGIAGFILSIGMAVDANILIFERMKEELRLGKPLSIAMELGFSRAWSSIRDSNVSTLITSGVLFEFGTGIVRGFAVTLAIGVLISMFSAIVVTRTLIRVFYRH